MKGNVTREWMAKFCMKIKLVFPKYPLALKPLKLWMESGCRDLASYPHVRLSRLPGRAPFPDPPLLTDFSLVRTLERVLCLGHC